VGLVNFAGGSPFKIQTLDHRHTMNPHAFLTRGCLGTSF
jgi:hypothetical protein